MKPVLFVIAYFGIGLGFVASEWYHDPRIQRADLLPKLLAAVVVASIWPVVVFGRLEK